MKFKVLIVVCLVILLGIAVFAIKDMPSVGKEKFTADVFVGIDVAYDNITKITSLIDEISSYTNLFIVGCTAITENEGRLNEICQYLYEKDFSFIIYQSIPIGLQEYSAVSFNRTRPSNDSNVRYPPSLFNSLPNWTLPRQTSNYEFPNYNPMASNWTEVAKNRWDTHFLGLYYADEPAGRQLDLDRGWTVVRNAIDYSDASGQFNRAINNSVNWYRNGYSNWTDISLFTSDYALYHFDYEAGYDVILAQLGWNYSRQLNIGLVRGAATLQNKDWGVIVTWEYDKPPYLESGAQLYNDLVLAYNNGAKYIAIFDSNEEYTESTLTEDHLNALKQFWQYTKENPRNVNSASERTAFVLPEDYAYGFRGPEDKIWGLWPADTLSMSLSINVASKLQEYGTKLDIVYNETQIQMANYKQIIYWQE